MAPAARRPAPVLQAAHPLRTDGARRGRTEPAPELARFTIALMNDGTIPAAPNAGIAAIEPAALQLAVRHAGAGCTATIPREATSAECAVLVGCVSGALVVRW